MKTVVALLVFVIGFFFAIWLGLYTMLFGGLVIGAEMITGEYEGVIMAKDIVLTFLRVVFAIPTTWFCILITTLISKSLIGSESSRFDRI